MPGITHFIGAVALLLLAVSFGINGARQAHAEPPDACLHFALCSQ
jgi:hypothetical protein